MIRSGAEKVYEKLAFFYDFFFGPVFQRGRKSILEQLKLEPGAKILEVGVGTGLSLELYPSSVEVTGIDLTPNMLKKAKERVKKKNLTWVRTLEIMDAQKMTFAPETFDVVIGMYVASVVPDPGKLVEEMKRVCKRGGKIYFVNHFTSKNPLLRKLEKVASRFPQVLGFHADFPLESFLEKLNVPSENIRLETVSLYWKLLSFTNE